MGVITLSPLKSFGLVEFGHRLPVGIRLRVHQSQQLVGGNEIGIEFQDPFALLDGCVMPAQQKVSPGQRSLHAGRNRIELRGVLHGDKAFFAASHPEQRVAVILVGDRVVGVNGDGSFEFPLGARPVPIVISERGEQRDVGLGEPVIQG